MESCSYLKEACHSTGDFHSPFARVCDPGEDLQESAFTRSISANDADYLSTPYFEINLPESPKLLHFLACHRRAEPIRTRASESLDLSSNHLAQCCVTLTLNVVAD